MPAPPSNRPGPYTDPEEKPTQPPVNPAGTVPPVLPTDLTYIEPLEPSLLETFQTRRRRVPLWIPIIGIGCLVAAVIFGVANINQPQAQLQGNTPVAAITATEGAISTAETAATPTIVQVVVPPSTPTPRAAGQPASLATTAPQETALVVQPTPTAQPVAPTVAPPEPTATPRPAPTVPPVAVVGTMQPAAPTQPQPTAVQPTATLAPAPTATLPPAAAQPTAVQGATPTAAASQPAGTVIPPSPVPLDSQAIGLFKTEWEKWHGKGDQQDNGIYYENQKYLVVFYEDRIVRLERLYGSTPATLDAARTESKNFLPQDAQLVQSYLGPDNVPVDLYKSEALKAYFTGVTDPDFWKGGEPGNFIVQYRKADQADLFSAIVITLGNNPQKMP